VVLIFKWSDLALAYRLNSAQQALRARDWVGANEILERSRQRGEMSGQWHYLQACSERRAGQVAQAQRHLARAAALGWNPADIDRQRLLMKAESGQIKQVEGRLAELLQSEVSDEAGEEIYEAMARGYLASLHIMDATKCLRYWVEWQPDNHVPHLWMGDLYQRIENPVAAADEYKRVLDLRPQHAEARLKLAQIYLEQSQVDDAAVLFEDCTSDSAHAAQSLLGLAECRRRQGSTTAAKALLYDVLVLELTSEQSAQALASLGRIALEDRDFAAAIDLLERSISQNPIESDGHIALAGALMAVGQTQLAEVERARARQLVEENNRLQSLTREAVARPSNADLRSEVGLILIQHGLWSAGRDWLQSAVQIDPGHRAAHQGLAQYFEQIGDLAQAKQHQLIANQAARPSPAEEKGEDG
jgi:Tfp pilus assembly protein PilF